MLAIRENMSTRKLNLLRYIYKGLPKKCFYVDMDNSVSSWMTTVLINGQYYVNKGILSAKGQKSADYLKEPVESSKVYELTRLHRKSKLNKFLQMLAKLNKFVQMLATLRLLNSKMPMEYYVLCYSWTDESTEERKMLVGRPCQ